MCVDAQISGGTCTHRHLHTIRAQTNSNDFVVFGFFFRRRSNYFFIKNLFGFIVCSGFNHMQCDCTCAFAVACLHPDNNIPNVVVSVTIHDNMCVLCLFSWQDPTDGELRLRSATSGETLWWSSDTHSRAHRLIYLLKGATDKPNHLVCLCSALNVKVAKSQTSMGKRPS